MHPAYTAMEKSIHRCHRLRRNLYNDLRLCRQLAAESAENADLRNLTPSPKPPSSRSWMQSKQILRLRLIKS
jgi:hypothetical protein